MSLDQRECSPIGRLHVVTDYLFQQKYTHEQLAQMAIEGGADTIQFRQKGGSIRHRLISAVRTADVCKRLSTPLIIDDEITIAQAVSAEGVHLGQLDFPVDGARLILGNSVLIGATATSVDQAVRAEQLGADYIGFGPVFETRSKSNPAPTTGLSVLRDACAAVSIPVIAIAGVTPDRVESVLEAGAYGIAVMSAITMAADPQTAAAEFRAKLDKVV